MDILQVLQHLLPLGTDWDITKVNLLEDTNRIDIYVSYKPNNFLINTTHHKLYDELPEREWQHLPWFQYQCYIKCKVPRYVNSNNEVRAIPVPWATNRKGYTTLFATHIIATLQLVQVQSKVAQICQTTDYIVRSIMENAVEGALSKRGTITDIEHISIDEKAFAKGHEYASIVIDAKEAKVLELTEGRKAENVLAMMFALTNEEELPQIKMVNLDMWEAYINVMKKIAPNAIQVHDKFHLIKKLSDAINSIRRKEAKHEPLLQKARFTVLKNEENRTEKQAEQFKAINEANLLTAQAWRVRENFKALFEQNEMLPLIELYDLWVEDAIKTGIKSVMEVVKTFERHLDGIFNAILYKTTSAQHERINGNIQSLIAKARGFASFDRFRINVMFYFAKLQFSHKI
jgi:transposase